MRINTRKGSADVAADQIGAVQASLDGPVAVGADGEIINPPY